VLRNFLPDSAAAEPIKRALQACKQHFWWAALFSAWVNLLYLTPTLYMMQVYDRVVPTGGITTLALLTIAMIAALASLSALDWLRSRLLLRSSLRLDRLLSAPILGRLASQDTHSSNTRVLREFDHVRTAMSGQATLALFDAPWTPIYLLCCFMLHPAIGVFTLVGGTALFLLATANERANRNTLKDAMNATNSAYAAQEALTGQFEIVRALGMREASIRQQIGARRGAVLTQAAGQITSGNYNSLIKFLRLSLQSLSLGLAAWLTVKGQVSAGAIIASSVLLSRAVAPIEILVGAWPSIVQAKASWKVILDLFSQPPSEEDRATQLPAPTGRLNLENVSLRHQGTEDAQLRLISLDVRPGQTLGIIGPSGSGKSSLARIIAGGLRPTGGTIRLDDAAYEAWDGDRLAQFIGYLPQSPSLFPGTIKENIARFSTMTEADKDTIDQQVMDAAQAAGAHRLILQLPKGYDTQLGPFGTGVSAGQAQRIALARALFRNPILLILDEPNSNLDHEGEVALNQAIKKSAERGAAVILIAHRAGILSQVDRLALMNGGKLVTEGPREQVLRSIRTPNTNPAPAQ